MNEQDIRRAGTALLQEVAHYQLTNTGALTSIADVQELLAAEPALHRTLLKDANITDLSCLGDLVLIMGGNFDLDAKAAFTVTIQNKVEISVFGGNKKSVEIKTHLNEGETIKVYDYAKMLDAVHLAYKTGKTLDIEQFDIANIIRSMGK